MTYFVLIYVRTYDLMILYYPLLASLYVNSRSCVYKLRKRCWYGTVPHSSLFSWYFDVNYHTTFIYGAWTVSVLYWYGTVPFTLIIKVDFKSAHVPQYVHSYGSSLVHILWYGTCGIREEERTSYTVVLNKITSYTYNTTVQYAYIQLCQVRYYV